MVLQLLRPEPVLLALHLLREALGHEALLLPLPPQLLLARGALDLVLGLHALPILHRRDPRVNLPLRLLVGPLVELCVLLAVEAAVLLDPLVLPRLLVRDLLVELEAHALLHDLLGLLLPRGVLFLQAGHHLRELRGRSR